MDGNAVISGNFLGRTGAANDIGVRRHEGMMHYASQNDKCQMHHGGAYALDMSEMSDRLRAAREAAGYSTAKEAAEAMGAAFSTYIQHENGIRNFPGDRAKRYARFFRTTPEWLLYGRGKGESQLPSTAELEAMIQDALSEVVTLNTKLSDLPRIVAPSLHEQLERFLADRAGNGSGDQGKSPDKGAQPLATTN